MMKDDSNEDNDGYMSPVPLTLGGPLIAGNGAVPGGALPIKRDQLEILAQLAKNKKAQMAAPPPMSKMAPMPPRAVASPGSDDSAPDTDVAAPAPRPVDATLQRYIDSQEEGVNSAEKAARDFGAKPGETNYSPLLGLIDSWTGTRLQPGYKAPLSDQERESKYRDLQDKALTQRQKLTSDLVGLKKSQNTSDSAELRALLLGANRNLAGGGVQSADDKKYDRLEDKFRATMDPSTARNSVGTGALMQRKESINALFALAAAQPDLNFVGTEMEDFATAMAGVIGRGSASQADAKIQRLLPNTAQGKFKSWQEFLMNNPTGKDQQEFVHRMLADVASEDDNVNQRLKQYKQGKQALFRQLQKKRPDVWNDAEDAWKEFTDTPPAYNMVKQRVLARVNALRDAQRKAGMKGVKPQAAAPRAPQAATAPPVGLTPEEQIEFDQLNQKFGGQ